MQPLTFTRFVLCFLLAITVSGCSNAKKLEEHFLTIVPFPDLNKSLQVAVDGEKTSFERGEEIALTLHNNSPYRLSLDTKSFVILLGNQDNIQWVNVNNTYTYSGKLELAPNGTILLDTRRTTVEPILDQSSFDLKKDVHLRIVLVGGIMEGENLAREKVATYVDVVIKP